MLSRTLRKLFGFESRLNKRDRLPRRVSLQVEQLEERTLLNASLQLSLGAPSTAAAGSAVIYTITVSNTGSDDAQNVTLSDYLPSGMTYQSQSQTSGTSFMLGTGGNGVDDTISSLAVGASATFSVTAQVDSGDYGGMVLYDSATATASNASSAGASASTTVEGSSQGAPYLSVSLGAPSSAAAGSDITYSITVSNSGSAPATGVALTDALPSGLTFLSQTQPSGQGFTLGTSGNGIDDTVSSLAAGASATFSVTAQVNSGDYGGMVLYDTATATAGNASSAYASASTTVEGSSQGSPYLSVSLDAPSSAAAGSDITYSITVSNSGSAPATGVALTDALPSGLTFLSQTQPSGQGFTLGTSGNGIDDTVASLAVGASATFSVTAQVDSGDYGGMVLYDTATAAASNASAAGASTSTTVEGSSQGSPYLSVSLDAPSSAAAGSDITYSITVSNSGSAPATGVALTDALPSGLTFVSQEQTGGPAFSLSTGGVDDTISSLAVGASATFSVTAQVDSSDYGGMVLYDTAVATAGNASSAGASASTTVEGSSQGSPYLSVSLDAPSSAAAGSDITYSITVSNSGSAPATGVALTDALPSGLTFLSQTQPSGQGFMLGTSGNGIDDTVASLAVGASATFSVTAQVDSGDYGGMVLYDTATATAGNASSASASASTTVEGSSQGSPYLSVSLGAPSSAAAGSQIVYSITVSNSGSAPATGVALTDALPSGLTFVSQEQTGGPAFSLSTGGVDDTIDSLAVGASATFSVTAQVNSGDSNGMVLYDSATATASNASSAGASASTTVEGSSQGSPYLSVSLGAPSSAAAGSDITYSITVSNSGSAPATGVALTDALPSGLTFVSQEQTGGPAFSLSTGGVDDTISSLAVGASATFSVTAQIAPSESNGTVMFDTATATAGNASAASASASTTVDVQADVQVTVAAPPTVLAGGQLVYTVVVSNNGPGDAHDVALSDALPSGVAFVSQSQSGGPIFTLANNGNQISDTISTLSAGASATFSLVAQTPAYTPQGTPLSDTASVSAGTPDPVSSNNSSTAYTTVATQADLDVSISGPAGAIAGGPDPVDYTITVANNGPSDAQNVVLSDGLPAGLTFVSQSQTDGPAFSLGQNSIGVDDTISTLAAGASATFDLIARVNADVPDGTVLDDTATVAADTADPDLANNSATVSTTISAQAELQVSLADLVSYTVTLTNAGPTDAQDVTLSDNLPGGFTMVSETQTGGPTFTPGNGSESIDDLPAGATAAFTVVAAVPPGTAYSDALAGIASGSPTTWAGYPDPFANSASASTASGQTGLQVTSSDPANPTIAGDSFAYTVVVTNVGPSDAQNVVVAGAPPEQLVSYTATVTNAGAADALGVTLADVLPTGYVLFAQAQTGGPAATLAGAGGQFSDAIADLPAGAAATFSVTVLVPGGASVTDSFAGASVSAASAGADLQMAFSDPADAIGPSAVTLASATQTTDPGASAALPAADGSIRDAIGTLAAGASAVFQFVAAVPADMPRGTLLSNSVTAASDTTLVNPDEATASTKTLVGTRADLSVTVSGPPTVFADNDATYTVTVSNAGPSDAQKVVVGDVLPAGVAFVSQSGDPGFTLTNAGNAVTDMLATLPAGASASVTIVGLAAIGLVDGASVTDTAAVGAFTTDPDLANNNASVTTPVANLLADLAVTQTAGAAVVQAGGEALFTLTVTNNGPHAAQNVVLSDALPAGTLFDFESEMSGPAYTLAQGGGAATDTLASLASGASASFVVGVLIPAGTADAATLTAAATVSSDNQDPYPANNSASASTVAYVSVVTLTNPGAQTNTEGDAVQLFLAEGTDDRADPSGAQLTYAAVGLPNGLVLDQNTGVISGTLAAGDAGTWSVAVAAADGPYSAAQSFTWTIAPALTVTAPAAQSDVEGDAVEVPVTATDALGDPTFSAAGLPSGLQIDPATGLISGAIRPGAAGVYLVLVTATDGAYGGGAAFAWSVAPAVTVAGVVPPLGVVGQSATLALSATDAVPDHDPLTWSQTGLPAGLTLDPDSGIVSGTIAAAAAAGPYVVVVTATDGAYSGGRAFVWEVAAGPVGVADPGPQAALEGVPVSLPLTAVNADPEGGPLTWAETGLPAGLTIDPGSGLITGTFAAGASAAGPYAVTFTATDAAGDAGSRTFLWTVASPLTISSPGLPSGTAGLSASLQMTATDANPNGGAVTWTQTGLPPGLGINTNGLISGVIDGGAAADGPYLVTVTAADVYGSQARRTFLWSVADPLTIQDPGLQSSTASQAVSLPLHAVDADPDPSADELTWTQMGLPTGLDINPNSGVVSGTIAAAAYQSGPFVVVVTATDGDGNSASRAFVWSVADPVTVTNPGVALGEQGEPALLAMRAADVDADPETGPLYWTATGLPSGLNINAETGVISGTLDASAASSWATVTADDGPASASQTFLWLVGSPVTVTGGSRQSVAEGQSVTLALTATDANPAAAAAGYTWTETGLPPGLNIDPDSGVVSGTVQPGAYVAGPFVATITATDGDGFAGSQTLVWTVSDPVTVPAVAAQTATEGVPVTLAPTGADVNGGAAGVLTWTEAGLPGGLTINGQTGVISGTPQAGDAGAWLVVVTATDPSGAQASRAFVWTVAPAVTFVDPPGAQAGTAGAAITPVQVTAVDAAALTGGGLSYSAAGLPAGLNIDPNSGVISGTIAATAAGPYEVTVTASDGTYSAGASFLWAVAVPATATTPTSSVLGALDALFSAAGAAADDVLSGTVSLSTAVSDAALAALSQPGSTLASLPSTAENALQGLLLGGVGTAVRPEVAHPDNRPYLIQQNDLQAAQAYAAMQKAQQEAAAAQAQAQAEQRADLEQKKQAARLLYLAQQGVAAGGTLVSQQRNDDGTGVWILQTTLPGQSAPTLLYIRTERVDNPAYTTFLVAMRQAFIAQFGPPPDSDSLNLMGGVKAEFAWYAALSKYMKNMAASAPPQTLDVPVYVGIWPVGTATSSILAFYAAKQDNESIDWWDGFRDGIPIWGTAAKLEKAHHYWDAPDGKGAAYLQAAGWSFVDDIGYVMLVEDVVNGGYKLVKLVGKVGAETDAAEASLKAIGFIDRHVQGTLTKEELEAVRLVAKGHPTLQRAGFREGLQFIDTGAGDSKYVKNLHGILLESPEHAVPRGTLAEELQHAIDVSSGYHSPQRIAAWNRLHGENFNTVWHQGVFNRIADTLEAEEQDSIFHFFLKREDADAFRRAAEALGGRLR